MRAFTLFVLSVILSSLAFSQELTIRSEKNFGGTSAERGNRMLRMANGDLVICGYTSSDDGDIQPNSFGSGLYLMKLDKRKNIIWSKVYGSQWEYAENPVFAQTPDGGFIIAATNGFCSRNTPTYPTRLIWMVKVNDTGAVEWERCAAGNAPLEPAGIVPIGDGYMITASAQGSDGWMTGAKGRGDIFIARLDLQGNPVWMKMFGGSQLDRVKSMIKTSDGNFVIAGASGSMDGDITANTEPYRNGYLIKIDVNGNVLWQKSYGGTTTNIINDVIEDVDGSLYIAGEGSKDTDTWYYGADGWIAKLDRQGNVLWRKLIGGTGEDYFNCISKNEKNEIVVGGFTLSNNDELAANVNRYSNWVVKYNEVTKQTSQGFFGGTQYPHMVTDIQFDENNEIEFVATSPEDNPFMSQPKGSWDTWLVTLGAANKITGTVFLDADSNGIHDQNEKYYTAGKVRLTAANQPGWDHQIIPDGNGRFEFFTDTGTYTVQFIPDQRYHSVQPVSYSVSHSNYNNNDTADFAVVVAGKYTDLMVNITPLNRVRPGFTSNYLLTWSNVGTTPVSDVQLKISVDPQLHFVSADDTTYTVTNNVFKWNLGATAPADSGRIKLMLIADSPPLLNMNDTVNIEVSITPDSADATKEDNKITLRQVVVASHDPNDKTEMHAGRLSDEAYQRNEYLYYTIRFQNTGNDTAFNVRIADTLDEKLDPATLQMVAASHKHVLSIDSSRNLQWQFDNIKLVDSNRNEALSHGFVSYRIKPRQGLSPGTILTNKASIFFDFNLPVQTNVESTIIMDKPLKQGPETDTIANDTVPNNPGVNYGGIGVIDPEYPGTTINSYPNPTRGTITLRGLQVSKTYAVLIISPSGQVCMEKNIERQSTSRMHVGNLSSGLYFLQITDIERHRNLGVLKLIVE